MILMIFRETMTAQNMVVQKHPHKSAFLNREIHYKASLHRSIHLQNFSAQGHPFIKPLCAGASIYKTFLHRGIHLQKSLPAEASPLLPIKLIIA